MSLDYNNFKPLIKSIDAQESHDNGVLVLVTGSLTFTSGRTRYFSQSFFLAPQNKGFFVLNDIFKYLDEDLQKPKENMIRENGNVELEAQASISQTGETEQKANIDLINQSSVAKESVLEDVQLNSVQHKTVLTNAEENGALADQSVIPTHHEAPLPRNTPTTPAKDAPKLSYASIVRKEAPASSPPVQRSIPSRVVPSVERQTSTSSSQKGSPAESGASGAAVVSEAEGNGHSIYIRNLPNNATASQVEEIFKKFGVIKPSGVQVRSKQGGICFGFVEYEELVSVQNALEASPVLIGGKQAFVEEKKPGSGPGRAFRGRPMTGRGGFRADGARGGRPVYGGRGNGRAEFGNGTRNRGPQSIRNGFSEIPEGYQREYQLRNGRAVRRGGMMATSTPQVGSVVA
eukprot:TRINITY_DN3983_c0_g1_i2.p1 TRINITY_DN3983_c0_g1~~TRINITY_DN3983_c0_g1_i2.p1  ORF type:complete len:403 (+),score=106.26 TRINITY_DN3983_c0_g1_i2:475-1683(+)